MRRLLYLSILALGLGWAQNSPVPPESGAPVAPVPAPTSPGNAPAPAAPASPPAVPGGSPMPPESGSPMPTESGSAIPSQGSDFTVTLIAKVPELLGITPAQFSDYRKQGLSLAQIAVEQGLTLEQVQGQLEELYKQRIDQASAAGEVLPEQVAALKESAPETIATFINDLLGPVAVPQ